MVVILENAIEQNRDLFAAWAVLLIVLALLRFPKPIVAACLALGVGWVSVSFVGDVVGGYQIASMAMREEGRLSPPQ